MNDRTESIIACLWGSFLGLLLGTIVALLCMVGCNAPPQPVAIDEAFVLCVCVQQLMSENVSVENAAELNASDKLSNADVIALYALYEQEISKVWATLGGSATMRDAVTEWLKTNAIKETAPKIELQGDSLKESKKWDINGTLETHVPGNKQFPKHEMGHIQESKAGAGNGSAEIASLPRPASKPAVSVPQAGPLILFGYPGCEACQWIRQQFDAKGIAYTYRSVAPVAGVTYPHATRDGKHFNYTELKELLK